MNMIIRTYSELITIPTFKERYEYLRIGGRVGKDTFGFDRYLNQVLYKSKEWKHVRNIVIERDNGCDLAMEGYEIYDNIIVHHMNPITMEDLLYRRDYVLDPEYLVSTVHNTHNAIHYGDDSLIFTALTERRPNDTCPWRL